MIFARSLRTLVIVAFILSTGCERAPQVASEAIPLGVCVPDSLEIGEGNTITAASQRAIYDAVLDSLRNHYGKTALYLDPLVETVGRSVEFTRVHDSALVDHLMGSGRFAATCRADDDSRCDVDSVGVSVRFSAVLRPTGTDSVLVDMTQQTVRPVRDSSDWFLWATWVRFWVERDGRCWIVRDVEPKGSV
jgi:hypothetical protein